MNLNWLGIAMAVILLIMILRGYMRGLIKEVISLVIVFASLALVWVVNPYVSEFIREKTPIYAKVQEASADICQSAFDGYTDIKESQERNLVNQLPLPQFMKEKILENDTKEMRNRLNAKNFAQYVSGYLSMFITNGLSFLISYILASVILHVIAAILNGIAKLPIINGINRMAGGCVGGVKGIIFIWIVLLVITISSSTELGKNGMNLVKTDTFLSFMNEKNLLMQVFVNVFHGNM